MWPAATSTTMPSGSFRPSLTMVFKSEPSGFDERTRPAARSKKYKRLTVFADNFAVSDLEALEDGIGFFIPFWFYFAYRASFSRTGRYLFKGAHTKALRPVMALPRIRFCIWNVPS